MRFTGKRALVTGGGSGIGAATATRLQAEGAEVIVMGRRQAPLEAISSRFVVGDVSNPDDCQRAVEEAGPLDILVHNAGTSGTGWDDVLAVNLTAAHHLCSFAEQGLIERRGAIVTIGSTASVVSGAVDADYNAAKAGLVMLTRSLAVKLGPHGVRANSVCPGWVRTPMGEIDMRNGQRRRVVHDGCGGDGRRRSTCSSSTTTNMRDSQEAGLGGAETRSTTLPNRSRSSRRRAAAFISSS